MGESAVWLVQFDHVVHAQGPEQGGYGNAARAVDGVDGHLESRRSYGFPVHQVEVEDGLNVGVDPSPALLPRTEGLDGHVVRAGLGEPDDFSTGLSGDEMSLRVQQLEGIPLDGVVRGRQDDAPLCPLAHDGHLHRGGRGQAQVEDVDAQSHEGAGDQPLDHVARGTRVPTDHDGGARSALESRIRGNHSAYPWVERTMSGGVGCRLRSTDGAAEAGNAADERHASKLGVGEGPTNTK